MAAASGPAACAPWRPAFQSHICKMPSPEFVFSTVARNEQGRCVPRARYCGFRGFFGELQLHQEAEKELKQQEKEHDKDAPTNPPVFESDMPTITTDVRMEKVENVASSGGAVEAVFWIKEVMTQWRIKGKAFVIGGSPEEKEEREAREEVKKGMRMRDAGGTAVGGEWSWEREITMYFANHTPVMRGSFKYPPPGRPKSEVQSDQTLHMGEDVYDLHDPVARKHFRVVVIRPEEVERLDLSQYGNPKRWKWVFVDADEVGDKGTVVKEDGQRGRWQEIEIWP
ncbi:hypothetical protein VTN00DRAFT_9928 [Thermoascus crustaceus]|uniref:uncharacterized protein n=1 Tax=Thermoascus crustaceus TaxID=5088 RepID=UPI003742DDE4